MKALATLFLIDTERKMKIIIIICLIILYNQCRRKNYLTSSAILPARVSPWIRVETNADPTSFITLTGMDRKSFTKLLKIIFQDDDVVRKGRPSLLNKSGQLGLLLFYLGSTMQLKYLCLLFGVSPTTASEIIWNLIDKVILYLSLDRHSKIIFPKRAQMEYYAHLVSLREPTVTNVIGFVDGLSLPVQCGDDDLSQAEMYNGYRSDTHCNNVLCFNPLGIVMYAAINYPGSWHDSTVAVDLCQLAILKLAPHSFALCVDQGFPRSGDLEDVFVGPISKKRRRNLSDIVKDALLTQHAKYISLRQSAEWGMRSLQGTFTRLKSRLTSDKQKRSKLIHCIILLHNFRTHHVGLNEIAEVFNPEYEKYLNITGYDRIAKYFKDKKK